MTAIPADLSARRYGLGAIVLHWLIAALLVGQIWLGWYMGGLPDHSPAQDRVEGIHASLGLTILLLTVVRLVMALAYRPPALPQRMPAWDRRLAWAAHGLFYVLLFALPLSGWAIESIGSRPLSFWGLAWPHMPGIQPLAASIGRRAVGGPLRLAHTSILVWATIGLIGLHILGALKHQFDGAPVLWRIIPGLKGR